MHRILKKTTPILLLVSLLLLSSGCFLRLLFGSVAERDTDFGRVFVATIGGTWGPQAICHFDDEGVLVDCTYEFLDFEAEPPSIEITSSARLIRELGILGVFVDPLILQVPTGATNFVATMNDGSGPQSLIITEVGSFKADVGTEVFAEPGQKFVIVELPPAVLAALTSAGQLDGPFDFSYEFELPSLSPVDVKPMFAGKVVVDGETYYPPMLPCTTDFSSVPTLNIPVANTPQNLMPQVLASPAQGCDGQMYVFGAQTLAIPTLGQWGMLALALFLAAGSLYLLARRAA